MGVQALVTARKQPGQGLFFFKSSAYFTVYRSTEGVQLFYCREKYAFPRIQRGSNIFQGEGGGGGGGVQLFPGGGVQMLISIGTHITCDFSGGVRTS